MNILLHTIALEPARWTPQRVSQPLVELLPAIADAGFRQLEIFEPHLAFGDTSAILDKLSECQLAPIVLSSYLDLSSECAREIELLQDRLAAFQFQKVRIFPSGKPGLDHQPFLQRLRSLAESLSEVEFLLETHDGSLADKPVLVANLVAELDLANVGLLYQPTFFVADFALKQLEIQRAVIRHIHVQNRYPDLSFSTLANGVIPWEKIIPTLDQKVDLTLEFVPKGICTVAEFDLAATLQETVAERNFLNQMIVQKPA